MDFTFTDEHDDLRNTLKQFLENESNEQKVRELMETEKGYDPAVWKRMAEEVGLPGLIIPEEHGGAGFGYVELLIALEEMGKQLFCAPFLSTGVLAANTLLLAANPAAQKDLLPGIANGETLATLAFVEPSGRWDLAGIEMQARPEGDGFVLDGTKSFVLDGHVADLLLVAARVPGGGLGLFRADVGKIERTLLPGLDLTRKLATLEFKSTPATRIDAGRDVTAELEQVLARTVCALAAEQAGGAQRCLEMAVDYAKTRLQFGRPIGSYQAIKHACADMLVEVEFARSAAYQACFSAAESDDVVEIASLAKSYCSEAYFHAAADNIQIHGGMGFTWEHPAHLYFKRAKASEILFGDPAHHREVLAQRLGI